MTDRITGAQALARVRQIPGTQREAVIRLFASVDPFDPALTEKTPEWADVVARVFGGAMDAPTIRNGGPAVRDRAAAAQEEFDWAFSLYEEGSLDGGGTAHAALAFYWIAVGVQRVIVSIGRAMGGVPDDLAGFLRDIERVTGPLDSGPLSPPAPSAPGGQVRNRGSILAVVAVVALVVLYGGRRRRYGY